MSAARGGRETFTVRAPGKVMLFGEYAVVEGAPRAAVVAAVERGVTCRYEPGGASVELAVMGLTPPPGPDDPRLAFARAAVAHATGHAPGRYTLDSSALSTSDAEGRPHKLGLGSSAAVTVALVAALHVAAGETLGAPDSRRRIFEAALAAHRAASGGGSGADVAACTFGGPLRYTLAGPAPGEAHATPLPGGPAELWMIFAGASADTRALLAQVRGLRSRVSPQMWSAHMDALDAARRAAEAAWDAPGGDAFRLAVTAGREAILSLAGATGAPLRGPVEVADAVAALAAVLGGAWKTTGAGGGDLYWVVPPEGTDPAAVTRAAVARGLTTLRLPVDRGGVTVVDSL